MTADTLAAFYLGITVGVWLTCIVGAVLWSLMPREDMPVVTGAHSGDEDDDWDDDEEYPEGPIYPMIIDDDDWPYLGVAMQRAEHSIRRVNIVIDPNSNDSVLMQRGRVDE